MAGAAAARDVPHARLVLTAAFVLHVALTLWSTFHHEPWRDEADPWLLVRDASFAEMRISSANGGTPLLFHLSVLPFARAGFPYAAMQLVNLCFVWAAVLLVFRSRAFPLVVKVLFAFSYFPAFEFAAVARPYGLQMLLTFAIAAAWRARQEKPVRLAAAVALLANASTLGLVMAAVTGALFLWEAREAAGRRHVAAVALMLAGGVIALVQLWPAEGRQQVYTWVSADTLWYSLSSTFFPGGRVEMFVVPALIVLAIVTTGISRRVVPVLFLWMTGTLWMLIYVFVWMGGLRHAGLLLTLVIAAVWVADAYGPFRRERLLMAALAVSLAYSVVPAVEACVAETRHAFSGSREVAAHLESSGLARNATLVAHSMFWTSPLVYLPGVTVCDPATGHCGTFTLWRADAAEASRMPRVRQLELARERYAGRRWVYISNQPLRSEEAASYRLVFETQVPIWRMHSERYYIYEPLPVPAAPGALSGGTR